MELEKEGMFEKALTPSDVGKLNRLVIPKQQAERHFPLGEEVQGMVLSFEDEEGKPWRFRYSYWNSSQSYVLTKGWSRYVKHNSLHAGDIVLFRRLRSRSDRLFFACHHTNNTHVVASLVPYQPHSIHAGLLSPAHHQNQTTTVGNNNNNNNNNNSSKILRLFGVNVECHDHHQDQSEPSTPDGSSLSSQDLLLQVQPHHHHHHQQQFYPQAYYSNHIHNHMDSLSPEMSNP